MNHCCTENSPINWLKKDDDPAYQQLSDLELATFLNGLIVEKRGKKDGPQPAPEQKLNNNIIFMKLKIAFNLNAEQQTKTKAALEYFAGKAG